MNKEMKMYHKTTDMIKRFENGEKRYRQSALFHTIIQTLVRCDDPYVVIDQLINVVEDTQNAMSELHKRASFPIIINGGNE